MTERKVHSDSTWRERVIYSFSPWQLRIIKWGQKREPESLTWTILSLLLTLLSLPAPLFLKAFLAPLTWQGPSFFLRICFEWGRGWTCVLYNFKVCVCICVYLTCCGTGGSQYGTKHVWRHLSPGSGSRLMLLCKEIREGLVAQCGLGWTERRRWTGWQQIRWYSHYSKDLIWLNTFFRAVKVNTIITC